MPLKKNEKIEKVDRNNSQISDRQAAFEKAKADVEKRFGERAIQRLGDSSSLRVDVISTQSLGIDIATGVGGIPRGRITEIYGPESSGKTLFCLHVIAEAQRQGGTCVLVDAENAFDADHARSIGVDVDNLHVSQPESGEAALEIAQTMIASGAVDVLVVDSAAALVSRAEIEGEMGDSVTGDTPVFIKQNGILDIVPIEDLCGGKKTLSENRYQSVYRKTKGKEVDRIQVLTHEGWKNLNAVIYKKNRHNKPIVVTQTHNGMAKTTPDHSLFIGGKEVKPSELSLGSLLDIFAPEVENERTPLVENVAWLLGLFCAEGSLHGRTLHISATDMCIIEKAKAIAEENLSLKTKVETRIYSGGGQQKDLYILRCSIRKDVYALFSQCYSKKSKYKKIPNLILNANQSIKRAFLGGFNEGDGYKNGNYPHELFTTSFPLASGLHYLGYCLGCSSHVTSQIGENSNTVGISITMKDNPINQYENGMVKEIQTIASPEFLYDIETEAGTFVGGIGFIVHHNSHVGLQARLMSQAMRKLSSPIKATNTAVIFTNQLREKVGVMFGSPETTPGGRALKFYASLRLDIRRVETLKQGDEVLGIKSRVKVTKNKVAAPFREAEVDIMFSPEYKRGFSLSGEVIDFGVKDELIRKSGAFYSYGETRLGQGRENAKKFLEQNPDIMEQIRQEIMKKHIPSFVSGAEKED